MQAVQSSQAGGSLLYSSSTKHLTTNYSVRSAPAYTNPTFLPASSSTVDTMSNTPQAQLPTPINSDAPVEFIKRTSLQSKPRKLRSDYDDFEKSIHEDDENEMIELGKRIEKSVTSGGKSPPTRARKLNIRETHQYDDYGRALFTEEERELLGMSACCNTAPATTDTKQIQSSFRKMLESPLFAANSRCRSWTVLPCPA